MAVKIESLSILSLEEQEEALESMAEWCGGDNKNKWTTEDTRMIEIEVDGEFFKIHWKVNELLNSIYRMYEKEVIKNRNIE